MTPVEALVQIAQSAEYNAAASVTMMARIARNALRESGEHGLLSCVEFPGSYRITCYCGWQFHSNIGGIEPAETVRQHALAMQAAQ